MQVKTPHAVTRNIYADFMRFMLMSVIAGITAALVLTSAVLAVSSHAPGLSGSSAPLTSDGGKRLRSTWTGLPGAEAA